jgi:hypothetical protein
VLISPPRTGVAEPGTPLSILVLAAEGNECTGVDLGSGAFVRASWPGGTPPPDRDDAVALRPYQVARGVVGEDDSPPDPARPEGVVLKESPLPGGKMNPRRARRHLRPLLAPRGRPLLGFPGPSIPYWQLAGTHPSLALVPSEGLHVILAEGGVLRAGFHWDGLNHLFPLVEQRAYSLVVASGRTRLSAGALARVLGHQVSYLLLALSAPEGGHCYKTALALLA